ncbi:MAG: hypothetical protein ACREPQ_09700 [Rhodanobacter sp.]
MTAIATGAGIVELTMQHLLPAKFDGVVPRVLLLANGGQESEFVYRSQIGGPARSYWGFEQGGGIHGVLNAAPSKQYARSCCQLRAVAPVESDVYAAFLVDDPLACAFARLLLWCDPNPLPQLGDTAAAFASYLRNWRPGAYTRGTDEQRAAIQARYATNYEAALQAVNGCAA